MIEIVSVRVTFGGVVAIDDLTLRFDGRICGLIGPNGAGKTTLLNVLSGFQAPDSGQIIVDGNDCTAQSATSRARLGLRRTFQTDLVVDELTVWDNVLIAAESVGPRRQAHDEVEHTLRMLDLSDDRHTRVGMLDTFGRRLVEIGRAVVGRPSHVLMDEPGGGLGADESRRLGDLIQLLAAETKGQIVLVDHDVELISATCDQTACLDFGVLIAHGPTQQVLTSDAVRAAYLGSLDHEVAP